MIIAHISDIHIKNTQDHDKYRQVFDKLKESLDKNKPDLVVVTGDVAHSKTQISPEYVVLATEFFEMLCTSAGKVIVIPGNHDGNLKNLTREDSIKPIVDAVSKFHHNLFFARHSGKIDVALKQGFDFYHLSVFDNDWPLPEEIDQEVVNIALYHGCLMGAKTDLGHSLHGEVGVDIFSGFDYAMLGDIHKSNQKMTKDGKIRYAGSLIQQNFGEDPRKGYLLWDIKSKSDYTCEFVPVYNGSASVSLPIDKQDAKKELSNRYYTASSVRLLAEKRHNSAEIKKIIKDFKEKYPNIKNVFFKNGQVDQVEFQETKNQINSIKTDAGQESMLREYLELQKVDADIIKQALELNRHYEISEEGKAKFHQWSVKKLKWDNVFNYGAGNSVDFDSMSGLVGIFGKSFSGKSSIIDSLLLAMFESTTKVVEKNRQYINTSKEIASTEVEVEAGGEVYRICRVLEKVGADNSRGQLEFFRKSDGKWEPLNSDNKTQTETMIKDLFGTKDDFIMTSLSSQRGAHKFLEEKSTERKKILTKFLDVDFFLEKHDKANKDLLELKSTVKYLQNKTMPALDSLEVELNELRFTVSMLEVEKGKKEAKEAELIAKISELEKREARLDIDKMIDVEKEKVKLRDCLEEQITIKKELETLISEIAASEKMVGKIQKALNDINIDEITSNLKEVVTIKNELARIEEIKKSLEKEIEEIGIARADLDSVPCKTADVCKLAERARTILEAKDSEKLSKALLEQIKLADGFRESLKGLSEVDLKEKETAYKFLEDKLKSSKMDLESKISKRDMWEARKQKNDAEIAHAESVVAEYEGQQERYREKEEVGQQIEELKQEKSIVVTEKLRTISEIAGTDSQITEILGKISETERHNKELAELILKMKVLETYKGAVHSNGLPFYIIKQNIDRINSYIASVLEDIVEFEVFLQCTESKLMIMIEHPDQEPRPIETGSGAEWGLAAMGIRLALIGTTALPKSDILILDEPATEMDENIKQNFVKMISNIKPWFKTIIIISHLETLKDIVDTEIVIEKNKGDAFVKA